MVTRGRAAKKNFPKQRTPQEKRAVILPSRGGAVALAAIACGSGRHGGPPTAVQIPHHHGAAAANQKNTNKIELVVLAVLMVASSSTAGACMVPELP